MALDHQRVKELGRHRAQVQEVKRSAQHWRLVDCSEETLGRMRHALIEEMIALEAALNGANETFMQNIELAQPLATEEALQSVERMALEWQQLNTHLQEIDEAILERHLRQRLISLFGSVRRLNLVETFVFGLILIAIVLTLLEFVLPLSAETVNTILLVDSIICVFLIADFCLRLWLSEDRGWYFRRYWIDLFASIPFYELLRFGRLFRLLRLMRLSRAMRVLTFSFRGLDKLSATFRLNLLKRSILIAGALLFFGALSIISLEQGEQAPQDLIEGLWWSFTTVVTGGFADLYNPATVTGRFLTVGLVLLGLTVTGIFTASLTSVLVEDDATRLERQQLTLENKMKVIDQKLDLLSNETNEGLIALETVAQALSNQADRAGVAAVLAETMVTDFEALQASVHVLDPSRRLLVKIGSAGLATVAPPQRQPVGNAFIGKVVADLLRIPDLSETDIEPVTGPVAQVKGVALICPLLAGGELIGVMQAVMPEHLGRYYLYNRVPMTLAHHAAVAIRAAMLQQQLGDVQT